MKRAVLWDLDGTLVDSAELHWIAWRDTLAAEGVAITYEQFLDSFGQKNDRILRGWLREGAPADDIRRIGEAKEAEYRRLAREHGLAPLPGAAEWVAQLHAAKWGQAVASSAPRENVDVMLEALGLRDYFDVIAAAEDVSAGKPDPEVFLVAARRLNVPPDRCIVVEDAAAGIAAARRAGMRSIGVNATTTLASDISVRALSDLPADAFARLV